MNATTDILPFVDHEYLGFSLPYDENDADDTENDDHDNFHSGENRRSIGTGIGEEDAYEREMNRLGREWHHKCCEKHAEAKKIWCEYFANNGGISKPIDPNNSSLQSLIRKYEIPSLLRRKIWSECMRVDKLVAENEGYYEKILEVHKDHPCQSMSQIELDLHRTFPHHPYFHAEDSIGRQQMRRVLTALYVCFFLG